jgi:hypothetical protein
MKTSKLLLIAFLVLAAISSLSATGKRYAILVGVNDYLDQGIIDLATPRNDARDLAGSLAGWDRVFTMTDDADLRGPDAPTRTNIENRLSLLADLSNPDDTILFFFSGHGATGGDNESLLLPLDAALTRLDATTLRLSSVQSTLNARGKRNVVLMIDACRETVSATKGLSVVGAGGGGRDLNALYATQAGWYSYEDEAKRNGVFTRFLLAGLAGSADANRDGSVSLGELAAWLPGAVGDYALAKGIRQKPFASLRDPAIDDIALTAAAGWTQSGTQASATPTSVGMPDQLAGLLKEAEKTGEVLFATNFRDAGARKLTMREGGKIEIIAGRAITTGVGYQGGGGLIIPPRRIERNTRVAVLFAPTEGCGFALELMEPQEAGPPDCRAIMLTIDGDTPSITKITWRKPWDKTQPVFTTPPWDSREIRFVSGKPYLAVFTLDGKGILNVKLYNERGKANSFTFDQAFVDAPLDFLTRSNQGQIELQYLSITALD